MASTPSDVASFDYRSSSLWTRIFKDRKWLELADKIDTTDIDGYHPSCTPLLIGNDLSRTDTFDKGQYFILLSGDYSGDLRYHNTRFFASLRDDHEYDGGKKEVSFKSGLTVNVSEVISGTDEPRLPMQELFPRGKDFRLEYLFLNEAAPMIRTLSPSTIIGINGPSKTRCDVRYGCVLHVPYKGGITQWLLIDKGAIKAPVVDKRSPDMRDMRDNCELIMSMQVE
jgi:hypothetical protein